MYLLTHSLVLVLVAVMKPKVLKTKISHADPPTHSLPHPLIGLHVPTRSLNYPLSASATHWLSHPPPQWLTHSLPYSLTGPYLVTA